MKLTQLGLTAALALTFLLPATAAQNHQAAGVETLEQRNTRMTWFREAKFGLFIHWGVYSVPGGEWGRKTNYGEWILEQARIPVSRYEQFAKEFNPVKFDAKAWVKTATDAGMKYIVITSKHHDGFGMWPSALTDWCIKSTPFQRDPLRELAHECQKAGIRFCVYYSIMDWHHPNWGLRRAWNDTATGTPDMDRYTDYLKGQLKELVTNYRPSILWFDGEWESAWTHERGADVYKYLRALDPKLIINNRVDKGRADADGMSTNSVYVGDYGTPEQQIPPRGFGPGVDWESCMTLNNHWGYNKHDDNWKSAETIIRNLCDIASKGGNYLLNVGPTSEGLIPQPSIDRLAEVGTWLKVNGEAIYGSGPTPFGDAHGKFSTTEKDKRGDPRFIPVWDWRCTTKPGKLYVTVFDWPASGGLKLAGLQSKVKKAFLLANGKKLTVDQTAAGVTLKLSVETPDKIASVVCLEIKDPTAKVAPTE
ncbi:MAG TPA: alpha-L-fucosidase [Candidatus Paceibacterota bacterium]|nr:alpha-L-fucosidase [Verrucomicrobiota bacterium]HSA12853.1 alpha-L-fucosidase [Candidatus Paceibacterota bacterium]